MINILVMTHGDLAAGLCQAAQMIVGDQERLDYLSFRPDWSLDTLVTELKTKLGGFFNDDPTLVMVDLFGGSPSNAIASILGEGYEIGAVAGVNLPMLLEALMSRGEASDMASFSSALCETARESVVDIVGMLMTED